MSEKNTYEAHEDQSAKIADLQRQIEEYKSIFADVIFQCHDECTDFEHTKECLDETHTFIKEHGGLKAKLAKSESLLKRIEKRANQKWVDGLEYWKRNTLREIARYFSEDRG